MKLIEKLTWFLVVSLVINNFVVIESKADIKSETQEFTNIIIFADFYDSTDKFMESRRDKIIEMYNGTSYRSLSTYISTISSGKMKINNYFSQDKNLIIISYRLSKLRSYYNKTTEYEMLKEIIENISVDKSISLDMNNDGDVDNVTFVFSGFAADRNDIF